MKCQHIIDAINSKKQELELVDELIEVMEACESLALPTPKFTQKLASLKNRKANLPDRIKQLEHDLDECLHSQPGQ